MYSCLRGVSGWFIPLACGPGSPELSKSYIDMAGKKKWGKKNRTPRQTQPGIGRSAPVHVGGDVQNRSRRRELRRGRQRTRP